MLYSEKHSLVFGSKDAGIATSGISHRYPLHMHVVENTYLCYTCSICFRVLVFMRDTSRAAELPDGLIQQWASLIRRGKFAGLAVFMLEVLKPVGFVASQILWVADPLLQSLIGHSARNYALFLEDRGSIERLLATLEDQPLEPPA